MAVTGSCWVEGQYLHWINASGTEYRFLGTVVTTPTAMDGSVWIEGNTIHYIDETGGVERYVDGPTVATQIGLQGSVWVDDGWSAQLQLHWLNETTRDEYYAHQDTAHTDTHSNVAHSNSHTNVAHTDSHTN